MADKLDLLEQDIVALLQKHEPNMLRWNEIVENLWQTYQYRYKDQKGLGVAVTGKLKILVAKKKVDHRELFYGVPNSLTPDVLSSMENTRKAQADVDAIKVALEGLQRDFRYFREPTIIEVSCRAGKPPTVVEPILYMLANETGWKPQENPEREAKDAINLAGWFCWKQKGEQDPIAKELATEAINNASLDVRRRAETILKLFPELVPVACRRVLQWPRETQRRWRQLFGSEPPGPPNWGVGAIMGDSDETLNSLSRRRF